MALVNHRYTKDCSQLYRSIGLAHAWLQSFSVNIREVDNGSTEEGSSRQRTIGPRRLRIEFCGFFIRTRPRILLCDKMQERSVVACDDGVLTTAQRTGLPH